MEEIRRAQAKGLQIHGPQYPVLTGANLDQSGMEGAKFVCTRRRAMPKAKRRGGGDCSRHI
jgi:hypothetical protein